MSTATKIAEDLAAEYNRRARAGSLAGGQLAYTAGGAGDWFPAGTEIHAPADGIATVTIRRGTRMTTTRAGELIRWVTEQSSMWTVEFPAASIGDANDLIRQSRVYVLRAEMAGRLGFEATGCHEDVMALAGWLESRGITRYLTMHGA